MDGNPYSLARPIVEIGDPPRLLGTGFFVEVGEVSWLMTAKHVAESSEHLGVVDPGPVQNDDIFTNKSFEVLPVTNRVTSKELDIALLEVSHRFLNYAVIPFIWSSYMTDMLLNIEFSQSQAYVAERRFQVEPSHYVGYAIQHTILPERSTGASMHCMILPWPAMKGASGLL